MKIIIENLQNKTKVTSKINALLKISTLLSLETAEFKVPSEVCVTLVNDESIRQLNKKYRQIDLPTDVLSFPLVKMKEGNIKTAVGDTDLDKNLLLLGDIVISIETAEKKAEESGYTLEHELVFLTAHGMLHLLGYDHTDREAGKRMFAKQETVLEKYEKQKPG